MKKNKNYSAGKRESFKKNFDKFDQSDAVFEEEIFDDDFTQNRERLDKERLKVEPPVEPVYDFEDDIDDQYDPHEDNEEKELFEAQEEQYSGRKEVAGNSYSRRKEFHNLNQMESRGQSLIFAFATIFLMGMGLPVLLIFYFNSPALDQHFFVLGLSYFEILFIFFITSAIMVYTSIFFLKGRQFTIISVFLLSLFCCFPFIAGIRNNLTMIQAILELKLFSNWPFFLKPAYLFFQFLLPFGIIIYIFLQIKNIFGKQKNSYAYICISLYLGIAAFIGFSILNRTGQPNIISLIAPRIGAMGLFDINNTMNEPAISRLAVSGSAISQPLMSEPVVSDMKPDLEPEFNELRDKSNHLLDLLSKIEVLLEEKYQGLKNSRIKLEDVPVQQADKSSGQSDNEQVQAEKIVKLADAPNLTELKSVLNKTGNLKTGQVNFADVEKELKEVSAKLDMILQAIAQEKEKELVNQKQ